MWGDKTNIIAEWEAGQCRPACHQNYFKAAYLLFHEVFIIKNVRRCVQDTEAHPLMALIAGRKRITAMHHSFMRGPMVLMVGHLIDAALRHSLASQKKYFARFASGGMPARPLPFGDHSACGCCQ